MKLQEQLKNSYKVENALKDKLTNEEEQENLLRETCLSIANNLIANPKVKTVIDNKEYLLTMTIKQIPIKKIHVVNKDIITVPEDHIVILMADINKHKLTGGKYIPYTATSKIDKNYSLRDNIICTVEGLIRHITGLIKPEILE